MNDKEFLKNLKAGDYVFVGKTLTKVQRLTPTGIIVVDGIKYNPNTGFSKGGDGWHFTSLSEATEEKIKEYHEAQFIKSVYRCINSMVISYQQAEEIAKIIGMERFNYECN